MSNQWEIIDDNGTLYSGSENGMRDLWTGNQDYIYTANKVKGDLRLVEIHGVKRECRIKQIDVLTSGPTV